MPALLHTPALACRLRRRAEDALKQPAAGVLAQATQAMGVQEMAAAAAAVTAAEAAEGAAAAAAAAGAGADGAQPAKPKKPSAKRSLGKPGRKGAAGGQAGGEEDEEAGGAYAGLEVAEVMGGGEQGEGVAADLEVAGGEMDRGAWGQLCSAMAAQVTERCAAAASMEAAAAVAAAAAPQPPAEVAGEGKGKKRARKGAKAADTAAAAAAGAAVAVAASTAQAPGYSARLPQLTAQLGRVLGSALEAAAAAPTAGAASTAAAATTAAATIDAPAADAAGEQEEAPLPLYAAVDDVAVSAAIRSSELKADTSKGAKLRKRKALTDLLEALRGLGLATAASAVPRDQRDVAAWFKQAPPALGSLLQQQGGKAAAAGAVPPAGGTAAAAAVPGEALAAGRRLWGRSQRYYFRSLARLQKLQLAARAPHPDVSPGEATAALRMCEHALFLARRQRAGLGSVAALHGQLLQLAGWMDGLAPQGGRSPAAGSAGLGAGSGVAAGAGEAVGKAETGLGESGVAGQVQVRVPPQATARRWMARQQESLQRLTLLLSQQAALLRAVATAGAAPGAPQRAAQALAPKCGAWAAAVAGLRARLDAEALRCRLQGKGAGVDVHTSPASTIWVPAAAWQLLANNYAALRAIHGEALAASPPSSTAPGMDQVLAELQGVAADALAYEAESASATGLSLQVGLAPGGALGAAGVAESAQGGALLDGLEGAIKSVLLWAQGVASAAGGPTQPAGAGAEGDAAGAGRSGSASGSDDTLPAWSDRWVKGAGIGRLEEVAAAAAACLRHVAGATTTTTPGNAPAGGAPTSGAQGSVAMPSPAAVARLSALAPALRLVAAALQHWSLRCLSLHKSLLKLSYICTSVFATLCAEGYCMPQGEGAEGEGQDDGKGEWKETQGTGLGEGDTKGAKDISDQLRDEDQLLGAKQKDQQQPEQPEQQQQEGQDDDTKVRCVMALGLSPFSSAFMLCLFASDSCQAPAGC